MGEQQLKGLHPHPTPGPGMKVQGGGGWPLELKERLSYVIIGGKNQHSLCAYGGQSLF